MQTINEQIIENTTVAVKELYGIEISPSQITFQKTRKDVEGDLTVVVFPFTRFSKKSPELTAEDIGNYLKNSVEHIESFNIIKGFLNLIVKPSYWLEFLKVNVGNNNFGIKSKRSNQPVVIEYSSPNTNKPLHLGHIRNNLLGWSVAEILKANGEDVKKVNLINDRGIHICKSMLAWQKWSNDATPESAGKKGDHFVGDYYVKFDQENRIQSDELTSQGIDKKEAEQKTHLMAEARGLLLKWEAKDNSVLELWSKMNNWAVQGFDVTYKRMGVDFDKVYYESQTYLLGKDLVSEGLEKGVFLKREDGSVWVDLANEGLDEKLLLRGDGTSVYITQDIGTAQLRYIDFEPQRMIYVVGNEQDYHFKVLKRILALLGKDWSEAIQHFSYGMVRLPEGKMKSREGKVVDADDLMDEMYIAAKTATEELGKTQDFSEGEKEKLFNMISLGALKYFILKVDPRKDMMFNPAESIDLNGNTGPFIQYTHARIKSLLRKADAQNVCYSNADIKDVGLQKQETELLKVLHQFPEVVGEAAKELNPAEIANYVYELAKHYNNFYQEIKILKEENETIKAFRLLLSELTSNVIFSAMKMLGIEVPERM